LSRTWSKSAFLNYQGLREKRAESKVLVNIGGGFTGIDPAAGKIWAREASGAGLARAVEKVLDWKAPFAKWFVGGKLNISENCLDRHLSGPRRNKAAIIWEGEPGDKRTLTTSSCIGKFALHANVLRRNNIKKGDR
jgi:hypothetical protein